MPWEVVLFVILGGALVVVTLPNKKCILIIATLCLWLGLSANSRPKIFTTHNYPVLYDQHNNAIVLYNEDNAERGPDDTNKPSVLSIKLRFGKTGDGATEVKRTIYKRFYLGMYWVFKDKWEVTKSDNLVLDHMPEAME